MVEGPSMEQPAQQRPNAETPKGPENAPKFNAADLAKKVGFDINPVKMVRRVVDAARGKLEDPAMIRHVLEQTSQGYEAVGLPHRTPKENQAQIQTIHNRIHKVDSFAKKLIPVLKSVLPTAAKPFTEDILRVAAGMLAIYPTALDQQVALTLSNMPGGREVAQAALKFYNTLKIPAAQPVTAAAAA